MSECNLETAVPDWLIEHPQILPVLEELGSTCLRAKHACGVSEHRILWARSTCCALQSHLQTLS